MATLHLATGGPRKRAPSHAPARPPDQPGREEKSVRAFRSRRQILPSSRMFVLEARLGPCCPHWVKKQQAKKSRPHFLLPDGHGRHPNHCLRDLQQLWCEKWGNLLSPVTSKASLKKTNHSPSPPTPLLSRAIVATSLNPDALFPQYTPWPAAAEPHPYMKNRILQVIQKLLWIQQTKTTKIPPESKVKRSLKNCLQNATNPLHSEYRCLSFHAGAHLINHALLRCHTSKEKIHFFACTKKNSPTQLRALRPRRASRKEGRSADF